MSAIKIMIHDHLEGLHPERYDVCIVGAGPVGISLALALGRLGIAVLVLESGGTRPSEQVQDLSAADIIDPGRHDSMAIAVARRFGGTSNLWGGRCLPYDPVDFEPRDGFPDWPIRHDEIMPYVGAACTMAHCGTPVFRDPAPYATAGDGSFSLDEIERWSGRPRFQIAHAGELRRSACIDIRLNTTLVDAVFSEGGLISDIVVGRLDGSRRTIPVRQLVLASGGLETTRLLLTWQRQAPARFGGPDGPLGRYYMGHLIGEIADITFANDRIDESFTFRLSPEPSYVRRRIVPSADTLRTHDLLNVAFWPVVPALADPRHGSGTLSLIYLGLTMPVLGHRLLPPALRKRHVGTDPQRLAHVRNVARRPTEAALTALAFAWRRYAAPIRMPGFFSRNPGRRYGLSYHAEQSPRADSRVWLGGERDALGVSRLVIDYRVHPDDVDSVVRVHDLLGGWLSRSAVGQLEYRQPAERNWEAVLALSGHGTHQIGTARLGLDRRSGVVDRNLATFDCPNLFVASTAILPRSGQANPTFTTIALALRLAAHLAGLSRVPVPSVSTRERVPEQAARDRHVHAATRA